MKTVLSITFIVLIFGILSVTGKCRHRHGKSRDHHRHRHRDDDSVETEEHTHKLKRPKSKHTRLPQSESQGRGLHGSGSTQDSNELLDAPVNIALGQDNRTLVYNSSNFSLVLHNLQGEIKFERPSDENGHNIFSHKHITLVHYPQDNSTNATLERSLEQLSQENLTDVNTNSSVQDNDTLGHQDGRRQHAYVSNISSPSKKHHHRRPVETVDLYNKSSKKDRYTYKRKNFVWRPMKRLNKPHTTHSKIDHWRPKKARDNSTQHIFPYKRQRYQEKNDHWKPRNKSTESSAKQKKIDRWTPQHMLSLEEHRRHHDHYRPKDIWDIEEAPLTPVEEELNPKSSKSSSSSSSSSYSSSSSVEYRRTKYSKGGNRGSKQNKSQQQGRTITDANNTANTTSSTSATPTSPKTNVTAAGRSLSNTVATAKTTSHPTIAGRRIDAAANTTQKAG